MHRSRKQGVPIWVLIALGTPLIGAGGWYVLGGALRERPAQFNLASAGAYYQRARERFESAQYPQALAELGHIPAEGEVDPDLAAKIAALRKDIAERVAASEASKNEIAGQEYFDSQLQGFVLRYMGGQVQSPQVRVFLRRARYFREKWPKHPALEWVARQEARFKDAVDLSAPPTFEDVRFEVESLTWAFPRDYREAFAVARAFQASASGADAQKAAQFLDQLKLEREAWFKERLEQARFDYEHDRQGESIGVLLQVVRYAGDVTMEDAAAEQLLRFGDMQTWLLGYRANDPEGFAAISKNRVIAAFLKEHKL